MIYTHHFFSPLGEMLMAGDEKGLSGLWFCGQKYFGLGLDPAHKEKALPVFNQTEQWLQIYFSGKEPDFSVPFHFSGSDFQKEVWKLLCTIPYGQTAAYGEIARRLALQKGLPHMSAQAVGGAVGHNKISILVPCHRVLGSNGSLTGYAGGLERKKYLLELEHILI